MRAHKSTLRLLVGLLALGWAGSFGPRSTSTGAATAGLTINKQPVYFVKRAFNPAAPPSDMPPLAPGEAAECSSAFAANASVEGVAQPWDATHATVTITHVVMTLEGEDHHLGAAQFDHASVGP
jgi:hypothetical protein